jgi:hypothetical protein
VSGFGPAKNDVLTLDEAVDLVAMTRMELTEAIRTNRLPAIRLPRRHGQVGLRLRREDLKGFAGSRWIGDARGRKELVRLGLDVLSCCLEDGCPRYAPGDHCPGHAALRGTQPEPLRRPLTEMETTAYHEAGHAQVAAELDWKVYEVTIERRRDDRALFGVRGGECQVEMPSKGTLDSIRSELTFSLAGRIAVAMAKREDWRAISLDDMRESEGLGGKYWLHGVRDALAASEGDNAELAAYHWLDRETPKAGKKAFEILERDFIAVCWTATELLKRRTLAASELFGKRIPRSSSPGAAPSRSAAPWDALEHGF